MGILTADELDMKLDFADPRSYGLLGLGTAAAVVIDEDTDIRLVLANMARFYAHESCGQCTQCREGTTWMHKMASRLALGAGRMEDLDLLVQVPDTMGMMPGLSICGLSDGAVFAIKTTVQKFRSELEERIREQDTAAASRVLAVLN